MKPELNSKSDCEAANDGINDCLLVHRGSHPDHTVAIGVGPGPEGFHAARPSKTGCDKTFSKHAFTLAK